MKNVKIQPVQSAIHVVPSDRSVIGFSISPQTGAIIGCAMSATQCSLMIVLEPLAARTIPQSDLRLRTNEGRNNAAKRNELARQTEPNQPHRLVNRMERS
jgi:hypothetical protein